MTHKIHLLSKRTRVAGSPSSENLNVSITHETHLSVGVDASLHPFDVKYIKRVLEGGAHQD